MKETLTSDLDTYPKDMLSFAYSLVKTLSSTVLQLTLCKTELVTCCLVNIFISYRLRVVIIGRSIPTDGLGI